MRNFKFKSFVAIIIAAIIGVMLICGCESTPKREVGWYKGVRMVVEGEPTSLTAFETLFGMNVVAVFRQNGTGYFDMMGGQITDFRYSNNNIIIEGQETPYTLDDEGLLKIAIFDSEIELQRQEGEPPELSTENDVSKLLGELGAGN